MMWPENGVITCSNAILRPFRIVDPNRGQYELGDLTEYI